MHLEEFQSVPYEQFRDRLRSHRYQLQRVLNKATSDEVDLIHDRKLYPRKMVNSKNQLVFDLSPAKQYLRDDIANNRHKTMTASAFHRSRSVYRLFEPKIFYGRVAQEIRRKKCVNYRQIQNQKAGYNLTSDYLEMM